ncbi:MAG: DNA glycosylase [Verrucomicrobiota bacterium]|nr:hypothetical protein [Limisphaera sp.]MDW8382428.1 DNA glycosylase [Verrucomicrobiota bacterium]
MNVGGYGECRGQCAAAVEKVWTVDDYRLDLTLSCGQVFRWQYRGHRWLGVIQGCRVELEQEGRLLRARVIGLEPSLSVVEEYLQVQLDFAEVVRSFPADPALHGAVQRWRGLRLLRQPFWECLASFILSSNKRIEQIRQVIERICQRWGDMVVAPAGAEPVWSFPGPERIAALDERELRQCGMGFRAAYLRAAARMVLQLGWADTGPPERSYLAARERLMTLPGVGPKIADCVCLFALGFYEAFPVDTWVARVIRERYRWMGRISPEVIATRARHYFGPFAGYAQQYLFHDRRMQAKRDNGLPQHASFSDRLILPAL